ncbi:MAG TPA: hypothetical protein VJ716_06650 [Gaiellaceae bacterium]|nr:hypothetical protein [Gaiellaceae bacterium]
MRAALLLAVAGVAALTACGAGSETRPQAIRFGLSGGNIAGYTISIRPTGKVTTTSPVARLGHRRIPVRRVRRLGHEIERAHLATSRICPGALPDIATRYIRLGSHTSRLRGDCEPRFRRVWNDLLRAVGRAPS